MAPSNGKIWAHKWARVSTPFHVTCGSPETHLRKFSCSVLGGNLLCVCVVISFVSCSVPQTYDTARVGAAPKSLEHGVAVEGVVGFTSNVASTKAAASNQSNCTKNCRWSTHLLQSKKAFGELLLNAPTDEQKSEKREKRERR